jgi:hypothetical protein
LNTTIIKMSFMPSRIKLENVWPMLNCRNIVIIIAR